MAKHANQPRAGDAVLGGQNPVPVGAAVLGGLQGVKMRLTSAVVEQQIVALFEALKYGESGLDLVIQALKDKLPVQRHANAAELRSTLLQAPGCEGCFS